MHPGIDDYERYKAESEAQNILPENPKKWKAKDEYHRLSKSGQLDFWPLYTGDWKKDKKDFKKWFKSSPHRRGDEGIII